MNFRFFGACDLTDCVQRNCIETLLDPEHQRLDDGQRERELQAEGGAQAGVCLDLDLRFQPLQHAQYYIHAHAAAGNLCNLVGCAETRLEDEIQSLRFVHPRQFLCSGHSQLDRFAANLFEIDTAPIVADLDHHLIALVVGVQPDAATRRLSCTSPLFWTLDAVTHRIANQV